jgi:hypothetical protein
MSSTSTTWTTDTNTKSGTVQVYTSNVSILKILGIEGGDSVLELFADEGDDNADKWRMWVNASDDDLHFSNYTSGSWANLLTIQDGGNVGIGLSDPARALEIESTSEQLRLSYDSSNQYEFVVDSSGNLAFKDKGGTINVHMLDNGKVGVGPAATSDVDAYFHVKADADDDGVLVLLENTQATVDDDDVVLQLAFSGDTDATNGHYIEFSDSNTAEMTGTIIASSGTATNNNVSDYRIKENISLITGGLEKINALKPSWFNYIDYPNKVHQGFIAHEVEEAGLGYAVFGEKDAMKINKKKGTPTYGEEVIKVQQFAIANIIPQMVSAIQELSAKVEALENNN